MPIDTNPFAIRANDKPFSPREYGRMLESVAQILREGGVVTTREASLFFGKDVMGFTGLMHMHKVKVNKVYGRKLFKLEDMQRMLNTISLREYSLNVYTGKRIRECKKTKLAMAQGVQAIMEAR